MQKLDNAKISKFRFLVTEAMKYVKYHAEKDSQNDFKAAEYALKYIENAAANILVGSI